jgi:hypothetical protein
MASRVHVGSELLDVCASSHSPFLLCPSSKMPADMAGMILLLIEYVLSKDSTHSATSHLAETRAANTNGISAIAGMGRVCLVAYLFCDLS